MDLGDIAAEKERATWRVADVGKHNIFVLGRNKYAESVAKSLDVAGFIDDTTLEREFLGKPVIRMVDLPAVSSFICSVVDGRPVTAVRRLREHAVRDVIDYFALLRQSPNQF